MILTMGKGTGSLSTNSMQADVDTAGERIDALRQELAEFDDFGCRTQVGKIQVGSTDSCPVYTNEFWTARQREAHRLHEISYRACFKPQLPRFFIERLTTIGDVVMDPFMGRGTTLLEAALLDRCPAGNDINPLSRMLIRPRLNPPRQGEVEERLEKMDLTGNVETWEDLLTFYHPETLLEVTHLRRLLLERQTNGTLDHIDEWIRMIAVNRLTGHSNGFFSVYSLPPNQAVSIQSQKRINERRNQVPPKRDIKSLISKKSANLLKSISETDRSALASRAPDARLTTGSADQLEGFASESVDLVVTSPPFLNIVNYATDNWLRCWFTGIESGDVEVLMSGSTRQWTIFMARVFRELARVLKASGHIAFEVGEVRQGKVRLEESVLEAAEAAGLRADLVLINAQEFTKTANCWGVDNNSGGTNTNRIVLLRKESK